MSHRRDRYTLFEDTPSQRGISKATSFRILKRSHRLFDAWRVKHPTYKHNSFYSMAHKIFSRLDNFFISAPLLSYTVDSNIYCPLHGQTMPLSH